VAFSPDGRLLASGGADNAVRVFELAPQESSGAAGHLLAVNAVAVSPDGRTVATAALDQTIKLWDLASGREAGTLIGKDDTPLSVTFAGNDAVVLGTRRRSQDTGELHFWGTKPGRLVRTVPTGEVYAVAGLADGSKVGVWSARPLVGDQPYKNSTFEIYDAKGEVLAAVPDKGRNVRAASFSPDLAWVAAGDETGTLRIWDMEKKERLGADWPLFSASFGDVGLTPDKKYLVAIDKNGLVKVADIAKRETLASATAHKAGVRGLLVSPKGDAFITIGADREVKAWSLGNLQSLKEVRSWKLPVGINGATYTPDGRSVVTANADGTAYVLELP
jgi:WD40 repeat protein